MSNPIWTKAIKASAEPQRAKHHLGLLMATHAATELSHASPERARILCALFSGAQASSNWLVAHPQALAALTPEKLAFPRRALGFQREVQDWLSPCLRDRDYSAALSRLRYFKQAEQLRIAARDLAGLGQVDEIIQELSDLADTCLDAVCRICLQRFFEKFGRPCHQEPSGKWRDTAFCILGMGKLGGQELNYSSDVDVLFVYSDEGGVFKDSPTAGKSPGMSSQQFFNRLAEDFISEVGRLSDEGFLYRIDLRLRPEGDSGPLARPLADYENYYAQWGQTWERMMLIKARCTAGSATLAAEFLEMIQPFRYPRLLGERVVQEIAAIKQRIEDEIVKTAELDRNVKLGRGGIREIEFVVQTLQLLNAGRMPFLQGSQTLPMLDKLSQYGLLTSEEARSLAEAYRFLRNVEHRLQMEENLQTHVIPVPRPARERLAALMGFKDSAQFETARARHAKTVRSVYDKLLHAEKPATQSSLPARFAGAEQQWLEILSRHSFKQPEHSLKLLREFVEGPGYVHVSTRTRELALQLLPRVFAMCPVAGGPARASDAETTVLSDPDRVLTRLDSFITAYGARMTLFETWSSNPLYLDLLVLLFDRSEFLAETAIRTPDLVDELVNGGRLRQRKDAREILKDLHHGKEDADQRLWLRKYHQAEQMRIGLRDILGLSDIEQNLAELTALAEACLQYALEVALRKHKLKSAAVAIIGFGKLGGVEISYGSDLDIVFVTSAPARDLPRLQRIAVEVTELLSSRTEHGFLFLTDLRLRPDGDKGLLVNTLESYEDYYRHRAQLWEIQSLSRSRPVAGDVAVGKSFQQFAQVLTDFRAENVQAGFMIPRPASKSRLKKPASGLTAYSSDWKQQIAHMRRRIEKERTPPGGEALAIKTGAGGLMDAEFIAQVFNIEHGWHEGGTMRCLVRAREERLLERRRADALIENYHRLRRIEGILRRWSFEGETVLPAEPAPFYRVAVRCGFASPEEFAASLKKTREELRLEYLRVFSEK